MAAANPLVSPVIPPQLGRNEGRKKKSARGAICDEAVQHDFDLQLGSMTPNGTRQRHVEFDAKDGEIESVVGVEARFSFEYKL